MIDTISSTKEADRVADAQTLLLNLGLNTGDPRWSSDMLDGIVKKVMANPGGSVGDLLKAALKILQDYRPELTRTLANVLKDLVVVCFTKERLSYDGIDWQKVIDSIGPSATQAQFYLAMRAVPGRFLTDEVAHRILSELADTPYGSEAANVLAA